jgi:hypothetical protein
MQEKQLSSLWRAVERAGRSPDGVTARQLPDIAIGGRAAFIASDWQGYRHLLLPIADDAGLEGLSTAVMHFSRRELVDEGDLRPFADVLCARTHLNGLFDVIATEILAATAEADLQAVPVVCGRVIGRWRELLERLGGPAVAREVLMGAWAELWFVRELLRSGAPFDGLWRGPDGAIHDIVCGSWHIEVKSTLSHGPLLIEIHGVDQLDVADGSRLSLGILRLDVGDSSSENLRSLEATAIDAGADAGVLRTGLGKLGISTADDSHGLTAFDIREARIFVVSDAFPRLTRGSFAVGHMPDGIGSLVYTVDLTAIPAVATGEAAVKKTIAEMVSVGN